MAKMTMDEVLAAVNVEIGKPQRRLFKKKRGGQVLTREQVKAIKQGRKLLKKAMKKKSIKGKEEFNLMASSMGLYFDKRKFLAFLGWLLHGRGLWALLGALLALLAVIFLYASVTQMRGHFTINMSDGMFREGFVLSETADFANPTTHLFAERAIDVPCVSISHIPADIDEFEGQHNAEYFAYTFFLRNEGQSSVGYDWTMMLNSESLNVSDAAWVMIFEDGKMTFYAKPTESGDPQALPAFDDNSRGYVSLPLMKYSADPESQYQVIAQRNNLTYYRAVPKNFLSDVRIATGAQQNVEPMEVHKYTVVIWLEGDDPECTDELIGGHVGMEISMKLVSEESEEQNGFNEWRGRWEAFWDNLKFWDKK